MLLPLLCAALYHEPVIVVFWNVLQFVRYWGTVDIKAAEKQDDVCKRGTGNRCNELDCHKVYSALCRLCSRA